MAYNNKQYNTRFSGRYNTPGQFVSAGEAFPPQPQPQAQQRKSIPQNLQPIMRAQEDMPMDSEEMNQSVTSDDGSNRPYWMKSKLLGVKKVSNKERRRRQNRHLRRLLTPKNALMALNEMMLTDQVANQFKVEQVPVTTYKAANTLSFCADLTIEGTVYKGFGENKLTARNAAAEQAIRDLIIKKMNKTLNSDAGSVGSLGGEAGAEDEEALPMIQLASFALHKLFSEWEYEGHPVPLFKPAQQQQQQQQQETGLCESPVAVQVQAPRKALPANAAALHPVMLLAQMRPGLAYLEVPMDAPAADKHTKPAFTMAVDVDGVTYVGKGNNKKEARKMAAKAACSNLYNIVFDEDQQN